MGRKLLIVLVCIAALCSGCASSIKQTPTLPVSYGPLDHDKEVMDKLQEVFENAQSLKRNLRLNLPELRAIGRATRQAPVAVTKCNIRMLSAFIASDWVPMVIFGVPAGRRRFVAVVGYDSSTEELTIVDSLGYARTKVKYPEFFRRWVSPDKTCLLMFSRYVGDSAIKAALKKYLPEERAESIGIITPRDRLYRS